MSMHLTLKLAQELVDGAIALRGEDYVYGGGERADCAYVNKEEKFDFEKSSWEVTYHPGCIVGTAFLLAFPQIDQEDLYSKAVNESTCSSFIDWLHHNGYLRQSDDEAVDYLESLQQSQDAGRPWGEANEMAKQGMTWQSQGSHCGTYVKQ